MGIRVFGKDRQGKTFDSDSKAAKDMGLKSKELADLLKKEMPEAYINVIPSAGLPLSGNPNAPDSVSGLENGQHAVIAGTVTQVVPEVQPREPPALETVEEVTVEKSNKIDFVDGVAITAGDSTPDHKTVADVKMPGLSFTIK